ncbi:MAG: cytochrome c oxidase subunit II [Candidatus Nanopelagicales bacterium]|nr:cytochrome c oxidase subunit II [Candidatus Nanopelagicales bacterium]MCF8538108.1 cytochrome c oxidase subunit II [Candidatus Nanopelagicales bacterium]MCF8543377.1 cytochrome c oxidase subunit II [Candidatus Nanopelagicales bacterium]MCF8557794.1 cytochrome c oxidase subunit II [Candidatus Nanopelagicales bacterium]
MTATMPPPDAPEAPTNRPPSMHRVRNWIRRPYARWVMVLTVVIGFLLLPLCWLLLAAMNQTGAPASEIMQDIETTVFVFTIVSIPITAFVFAVLVYSLLGWKHVSGDEVPADESPAIRGNVIGATLWTVVSSLLAMFLVVWGLVELAQITANSYGTISADEQPGGKDALIVNVTGQQWVWTFEYPQHDGLTSDVLYLPKDRAVYFNVTSKDVIHNFWAVELGVKIDANPGAITQTGVTPNKAGTFNVRCAELCGLHHAYMETQIQVLEKDSFDSWVRESGGGRTS